MTLRENKSGMTNGTRVARETKTDATSIVGMWVHRCNQYKSIQGWRKEGLDGCSSNGDEPKIFIEKLP